MIANWGNRIVASIAQCPSYPIPVPHQCPASCTLAEAIACWLRESRRLRADLIATGDGPDAEILQADLSDAERTIDRLLAYGRRAV